MAKDEIYPDRNVFHKYMGPPDSCGKCGGLGWVYEMIKTANGEDDSIEAYCDCPCGKLRRELDSQQVRSGFENT